MQTPTSYKEIAANLGVELPSDVDPHAFLESCLESLQDQLVAQEESSPAEQENVVPSPTTASKPDFKTLMAMSGTEVLNRYLEIHPQCRCVVAEIPVTEKKNPAKRITKPIYRVYGLFADFQTLPIYIGVSRNRLATRLSLHRNAPRPTRKVIRDLEAAGHKVTIQEVFRVKGGKPEAQQAEYNVYRYYKNLGAKLCNDASKFCKLTNEQAREIRLLAKHGIKQKNLAREYGVGTCVIHDVVVGNTFRS